MEEFIKKGDDILTLVLGLILVGYGFVKGGYKFDSYPIGRIFGVIGGVLIISKYFLKKND